MWLQQVTDDGQSLIFIKNISQSKIKELREILMGKIQGVKNFLPLLNKVRSETKSMPVTVMSNVLRPVFTLPFQVFIEFESPHDADRLGVWYSLLREDLGLEVYRQKIPREDSTSLRTSLKISFRMPIKIDIFVTNCENI